MTARRITPRQLAEQVAGESKPDSKSHKAAAVNMLKQQADTALVSADVIDGLLRRLTFVGFRALSWSALYGPATRWQYAQIAELYTKPLRRLLAESVGLWQVHPEPVGIVAVQYGAGTLPDSRNLCDKQLIDLLTVTKPTKPRAPKPGQKPRPPKPPNIAPALVDDGLPWVAWGHSRVVRVPPPTTPVFTIDFLPANALAWRNP